MNRTSVGALLLMVASGVSVSAVWAAEAQATAETTGAAPDAVAEGREPAPADASEANEPSSGPARASGTPDVFVPSVEVSEDLSVAFPVDI